MKSEEPTGDLGPTPVGNSTSSMVLCGFRVSLLVLLIGINFSVYLGVQMWVMKCQSFYCHHGQNWVHIEAQTSHEWTQIKKSIFLQVINCPNALHWWTLCTEEMCCCLRLGHKSRPTVDLHISQVKCIVFFGLQRPAFIGRKCLPVCKVSWEQLWRDTWASGSRSTFPWQVDSSAGSGGRVKNNAQSSPRHCRPIFCVYSYLDWREIKKIFSLCLKMLFIMRKIYTSFIISKLTI